MLVVNETTPRNLWPMGIVVDVNQGRYNLVRFVRLKTKSGELLRPVTKLVQHEANLTIYVPIYWLPTICYYIVIICLC